MVQVNAVDPTAPVQEFPAAGLMVGGAVARTKPAGSTSVTVAVTSVVPTGRGSRIVSV